MIIKGMNYVMVNVLCPVDSKAWMMLAWQFNCTKLVGEHSNAIPIQII
jgi:hypothetical protein